MRVYDIALFILLVNVISGFTVSQGLFSNEKFGTGGPIEDEDLTESLNLTAQDETGWKPFGGLPVFNFILSTLSALGNVVDIIWTAVFGLQPLVAQFLGGGAAANNVAWLITMPAWLVYIFAIAQFLRGIGAKGME